MLLLLNLSNALAMLFRFLPASGSNGSFVLCLILPQLDYKPKHLGIKCLISNITYLLALPIIAFSFF